MPDDKPVTLYSRSGKPQPFASDMVNSAIAAGWSYTPPTAKPAPAGQQPPLGHAGRGGFSGVMPPTAPKAGGSELGSFMGQVGQNIRGSLDPKSLIDMLRSVSAPGLAEQAYRHFKDPRGQPSMFPAAESTVSGYGRGLWHTSTPGIATDIVQKRDMAPTIANAALMMAGGMAKPEALAGTVDPLARSLDRIKNGSYSDVTAELEKYRKTVVEEPSKGQRIAAEKTHAAITERVSHEWDQLYKKLSNKVPDAIGIKSDLAKLAEIEPMVQDWLDANIKESASGQSVTAPVWPKVRDLSKDLNAMLGDDNVSFQEKARIKEAHAKLEDRLKASADEDGLKQQYTRAYQLSRKLNNIKHHTAFEHVPVRPSRLFGLGGATTGIATIGAEGVGGYFLGRQAGVAAGEAITPKGGTRTPELSRRGEAALWKELGEKPPKGTMRKVQRGRITHWQESEK